ncbi:hypothetical protein YC2023_047963 [Brassica napus]
MAAVRATPVDTKPCVEVDNGGIDTRFKLALKELEAAKLSEASHPIGVLPLEEENYRATN